MSIQKKTKKKNNPQQVGSNLPLVTLAAANHWKCVLQGRNTSSAFSDCDE